jgi:hypothetical protein
MVACSDGAASAWRRGPGVDSDLRTRNTEGVGGGQHSVKTQRHSGLPRKWRRELYPTRTRPRSAGTSATRREGGGAHCFSDGLHTERKRVRTRGQHLERTTVVAARGEHTTARRPYCERRSAFRQAGRLRIDVVGRLIPDRKRLEGAAQESQWECSCDRASYRWAPRVRFSRLRIKPENNFQHGKNR